MGHYQRWHAHGSRRQFHLQHSFVYFPSYLQFAGSSTGFWCKKARPSSDWPHSVQGGVVSAQSTQEFAGREKLVDIVGCRA